MKGMEQLLEPFKTHPYLGAVSSVILIFQNFVPAQIAQAPWAIDTFIHQATPTIQFIGMLLGCLVALLTIITLTQKALLNTLDFFDRFKKPKP